MEIVGGPTVTLREASDEQWRTEFVWMIERGNTSAPQFWSGGLMWSHNHNCGIRFCRKVDAERVVRALDSPDSDSMRVAEHGFSQREPSDRVAVDSPKSES